ncbi:MAG: AURKAIP1/COX24 domain-containing protein [Nitrospirae bacterium]|uniref:AURKAIP1/COX24 domain-containing protein n=1 Tax=Candidatus Magnetobacterium casense TaxID=1455061 RepID=A0ABS6RYA5_9BACT|nr:AURKAIP1/COX24 domain-containing protein [Candidatus Magnetobacterium casensis]MBF0336983.1 AURKAIP1/COX24 domain-containing protein [Nitrospirota bacterium]MBF0537900.1 AURKAIP1/COX24 domain-containing protein [Nitrospirota bacterium]MBF0590933.1 AURKAIP1/COX24 domain-containing protein [Nitrospirota bacterium]MBF0609170.1 AURKAIP1/COX24 domain-containing protein [Nitrospirota bacterium]MBV6341627.1 AURKAIP1/COX24 domain-containing protein [Candidatus Magnetobacterium casensis]
MGNVKKWRKKKMSKHKHKKLRRKMKFSRRRR